MKSYFKIDNKFNLEKSYSNKNEGNDKKKANKGLLISLNNLNIGFYLLTPILLGVFIGYNLDKYFDKRPIFTFTFIVLGTIGTFYNLIKLSKE